MLHQNAMKIIIQILVFLTSVSAPAGTSSKGTFRPLPGSCVANLKEMYSSKRLEALRTQYLSYFPNLSAAHGYEVLKYISYDPEMLGIFLELTNGVRDTEGEFIKHPLEQVEIEILIDKLLPRTGGHLLPELYNSSLVSRDPVLLYESLLDLAQTIASNPRQLTDAQRRMIYRKTLN